MEKRLFELKQLRVLLIFAALILFSFSVKGQTITGTVTDDNGEALIGANVSEKGTSNGTITDMNGKYTITVGTSATTLVFSALGFLPQEIVVGTQTTISVKLAPEENVYDEVVVVGYGTTKKKLTTGANMNVKGEDIQALNTTSAMDALKGITPGVSITQNNAQPGAGSKVYIRGIGTTGDAKPLYIVDGVIQGNIDYLNPNDIESIDVLKDAASAAIYGSRGANGVILVSTKQGKKNMKPVITYDGYYGVQNVYKKPDLLNAQEYAFIMDESVMHAGLPLHDFATLVPNWAEIQNGSWKGTNWFDEMMVKNAPVQSHSINIQGGSERSTYSLGASYLNQDGVFGKQSDSYYKRTNIRLNSEHALISKPTYDVVTIGENLTYTKTYNNGVRTGNIYWNDVHNAVVASPFLPIYDENGKYHKTIAWYPEYGANPAALMEYNTKNAGNDNNNLVGSAYLVIQPIKNLKYRTSFGVTAYWGSSRSWIPKYDLGGTVNVSDADKVTQGMFSGSSYIWDNTLTYSFKLQESHNFVVMIGNSVERSIRNENMSTTNKNSLFGDFAHAYITNASTVGNSTSISGRNDFGWGMLSYFGRVAYDYKETYLLSAMMRADGSSTFLPKNRWGYFPSVSAGWVVSNESFMSATSDWMNFLKIRGSWGQTGNQNVGGFLYSSTMAYTNAYNYYDATYGFGSDKTTRTIGSFPARIPNPDITWETSQQTNIGFDVHFLNSRLQATFDWYKKDTKNWLVNTEVPSSNGITSMTINGGSVTNKGIELSLTWNDKIGDFNYGAVVSLAHNKNKVTKIQNSEGIIHGPANVLSQGTSEMFRAQVGYPIGYFWGFQTDGIIQNYDEAAAWVAPAGASNAGQKYFADQKPGDLRWVDQNQDGKIDDKDKVMIGDPNPDYILGFQLHAEYKGIYLSATANGNYGQQIAKSYRSFADGYKNNYTTDILGRWHGEGTSNLIPILSATGHRNTQNISDLYIQNGDFLRISNITIGYDFKKLVKNLPLGEAKLYLTAKNLYTFTKYDGMDPEIGYGDDVKLYPWASGIDLGLYPSSRTILIGISLKF
jgi:TonB-dependent starch-binding outer membrane protein SusC